MTGTEEISREIERDSRRYPRDLDLEEDRNESRPDAL